LPPPHLPARPPLNISGWACQTGWALAKITSPFISHSPSPLGPPGISLCALSSLLPCFPVGFLLSACTSHNSLAPAAPAELRSPPPRCWPCPTATLSANLPRTPHARPPRQLLLTVLRGNRLIVALVGAVGSALLYVSVQVVPPLRILSACTFTGWFFPISWDFLFQITFPSFVGPVPCRASLSWFMPFSPLGSLGCFRGAFITWRPNTLVFLFLFFPCLSWFFLCLFLASAPHFPPPPLTHLPGQHTLRPPLCLAFLVPLARHYIFFVFWLLFFLISASPPVPGPSLHHPFYNPVWGFSLSPAFVLRQHPTASLTMLASPPLPHPPPLWSRFPAPPFGMLRTTQYFAFAGGRPGPPLLPSLSRRSTPVPFPYSLVSLRLCLFLPAGSRADVFQMAPPLCPLLFFPSRSLYAVAPPPHSCPPVPGSAPDHCSHSYATLAGFFAPSEASPADGNSLTLTAALFPWLAAALSYRQG